MKLRSAIILMTSYGTWQFVILECYNSQISICVVSSIVQFHKENKRSGFQLSLGQTTNKKAQAKPTWRSPGSRRTQFSAVLLDFHGSDITTRCGGGERKPRVGKSLQFWTAATAQVMPVFHARNPGRAQPRRHTASSKRIYE